MVIDFINTLKKKKMKRLANLKFMVMAMFVAMLSMSLTACSDDDDDDAGTAYSIIGTWVDTGDEKLSVTFKNDGTGYFSDESGNSNFIYTYSYDKSNDSGILKYWYVNSERVYSRTVTVTGSTMMWTYSGSTVIWKRK